MNAYCCNSKKKLMMVFYSVFLLHVGCTNHSYSLDQHPIYKNGIYFWHKTAQNTPIFTVVSADQKIGTQTKLRPDEISTLLETVCREFPKFKPSKGGEIYIMQNGRFQERYAMFFDNKLFYFDQNEFDRIELFLKKPSCS